MKNIKISPADSGRQRDNANYSCAMKRRMLSPWLTLVNRSSVRVPTKLAIISQVQHCRAQNAPQKSVPVFQSSNIDTNQLPTSGIWSKWRAEKSRNHTVSSIDNGSVRTPPARATHSTFNFAGTRDSWMACAIFCRRSDFACITRHVLNSMRPGDFHYAESQHHCLPENFQFVKSFLHDHNYFNIDPQNVQPPKFPDEMIKYFSLDLEGKPLLTTLAPLILNSPSEDPIDLDYI